MSETLNHNFDLKKTSTRLSREVVVLGRKSVAGMGAAALILIASISEKSEPSLTDKPVFRTLTAEPGDTYDSMAIDFLKMTDGDPKLSYTQIKPYMRDVLDLHDGVVTDPNDGVLYVGEQVRVDFPENFMDQGKQPNAVQIIADN